MVQRIHDFFLAIVLDALRATRWHDLKACWCCQQQIETHVHYCPWCGSNQLELRTDALHMLHLPAQSDERTLTEKMQAYASPQERPLATYIRLRHEGVVK